MPQRTHRHLFNVRRETLDPLLRQLANDYPNVDLLLGHRVSGLLTENGTTAGVYGTNRVRPSLSEHD